MSQITVQLLGSPLVSLDGEKMIFPYRKAEGLFYYLCVRKFISRDEAIGVLWADCDENAARKNLRDAIYNIRRILGTDIIFVHGNSSMELNQERILRIDLEDVTKDNILETYRGEFLGYFYVKKCLEFEEWAGEMREGLRQQYVAALKLEIARLIREKQCDDLEKSGFLLLNNHIYEEDLYRKIMDLLLKEGRCNSAIKLYQDLARSLEADLDTDPEMETQKLYKQAVWMKKQRREDHGQGEVYFYGRKAEIYEILSEIRRFGEGQACSCLLLTGEAGVGKTFLMNRIRSSLDPSFYLTFSCHCCQGERDLYLKPWHDIINQIQGYCNENKINTVPANHLLPLGNEEEIKFFLTRFELLMESLLKLMAEAGQKVIFFFDDIQWMDDTSLRLLRDILFHQGGREVFLVAACRDDCEGELESFRIPLLSHSLLKERGIQRFSREEVERIIWERLPKIAVQSEMLDRIYRDTEGNPLFLMELLEIILKKGDSDDLSTRTTSIIQSRLMTLSKEERGLLDVIAMFAHPASIEEICVLLTEDQLYERLDLLLAKRLIQETVQDERVCYRFTHQLIQDFVYGRQPEGKRKNRHRRLAGYYEALYQENHEINLCPLLTYHFGKCGEFYKKYNYRLEYMKELYANHHEVYPTTMAGMELDIRASFPLSGGDGLVDLVEEIRVLDQEKPEVMTLRMKAEYIMGRYDLFSGNYRHGLSCIRTSIRLAEWLGDQTYLFESYLQMIYYGIQVQDLDVMGEYLEKAGKLVEAGGQREANYYTVMRLKGLYQMKSSRFEQAEQALKESIRGLEKICTRDPSYQMGLAACYNYLGEIRLAQGKEESALDHFYRAIQCCQDRWVTNGLGVFYTNAGATLYEMGISEKSAVYLEKAIRCFQETQSIWGRAKAEAYAALLANQKQEQAAAWEHYELAKKIAKKMGNPSSLQVVRRVGAILHDRDLDGL